MNLRRAGTLRIRDYEAANIVIKIGRNMCLKAAIAQCSFYNQGLQNIILAAIINMKQPDCHTKYIK